MKRKSFSEKKIIGTGDLVQLGSNYLSEYISTFWHPYIIIIIIGILVFGRTVWFDYTYFDDDLIIIKKIDSLSHISGIFQSFKTLYFGPYYRPFITISLILDALISNVSPWMYHVSNLVYHLTAGCLTFFLLLKLQNSRFIALFASIVFILHPLSTQNVAWILGRNDSLMAVFILLSFIFFINSLTSGKYYFYLLHILFFYIALFTKESALIFPFVALLYYVLVNQASLFSTKIIKYIISWLLGLILWYFLRSSALSSLQLKTGVLSLKGVLSNCPAMIEMLGKLVFPVRLSVYPTIHPVSIILGIIAVIALIVFLIIRRGTINRLIIFSLFWIVLFNLPGLFVNIFDNQNRFSYLESRGYISIIGFAILITGIYGMRLNNSVKIIIPMFLLIFVLYSITIFSYSTSYQNPLNHWRKAVEMSPKASDAYFNLGLVSAQIYNNLEMAEENFTKAITLNSSNPSYHNWLGIMYGEKKIFDQAENEFIISIKLDSADPYPYSNLGYLNYLNKHLLEAEKYFKKSISVDSTFSEAYNKLISLYYQEKRYDEAIQYVTALKAKGLN